VWQSHRRSFFTSQTTSKISNLTNTQDLRATTESISRDGDHVERADGCKSSKRDAETERERECERECVCESERECVCVRERE